MVESRAESWPTGVFWLWFMFVSRQPARKEVAQKSVIRTSGLSDRISMLRKHHYRRQAFLPSELYLLYCALSPRNFLKELNTHVL